MKNPAPQSQKHIPKSPHVGQHRHWTFSLSQEVLLDSTALGDHLRLTLLGVLLGNDVA